jgi:leucyl-tRNA synthetase
MKNVIVNGIVLAEDGKKMSKSLKNYPDPQQLIEKWGGDSFRLHMLASPSVKAEPMRFNEKCTEQAFKDFTLPLQNVFNFFETYAKIDNRKFDGTEVYFTTTPFACYEGLSEEECRQISTEKLIRVSPELILSTKSLDDGEMQAIKAITDEYSNSEAEFQQISSETLDSFFSLIGQHKGKRILVVSEHFSTVWQQLYQVETITALKD